VTDLIRSFAASGEIVAAVAGVERECAKRPTIPPVAGD
jgi:hypothetical protein